MHEHRLIERVVAVLSTSLVTLRDEGSVDFAVMDAATDFIRTYADRCHHGKEEDILFRRAAEKDLEPGLREEMAVLIQEHETSRVLTRSLTAANARLQKGEIEARDEIVSSLAGLVGLYPRHIEKEERHFFKPCLEYFSQDERAQMLLDFDALEQRVLHEKYGQVVDYLESTA